MTGGSRHRIEAGAILALAAVAASCSGGGTPATGVPSWSGSPSAVSPGMETGIGPSVAASEAAASPVLPSAPPGADLEGLDGGGTAAGELGSYTWAGGGSDAPWIVASPVGSVGGRAQLRVTFGTLRAAAWNAGWARVEEGVASDQVGGAAGTGDVVLPAPATSGDWSLRVTAEFGAGANATYYWRVTVVP